jgi:hypothetical protein
MSLLFRVDASQAGEGQLEISINDGEVSLGYTGSERDMKGPKIKFKLFFYEWTSNPCSRAGRFLCESD